MVMGSAAKRIRAWTGDEQMDKPLVIAGKEFSSRLMAGTGRHRNMEEMVDSIEASGAEIVTVAIRRLNLDNPAEKSILDSLHRSLHGHFFLY